MRSRRVDVVLLAMAIGLAIASYLMFRTMITDQSPPYAVEIASALMGGLVTVVITAVLLQKQSEVEMRRERNARMLDAELAAYGTPMDKIEELLSRGGEVGRGQLVGMQMLHQRLTYTAGEEVVEAFRELADAFTRAAVDRKVTDAEMNSLLEKAGVLGVAMRKDLLTEE
jgi:hypothetical protein